MNNYKADPEEKVPFFKKIKSIIIEYYKEEEKSIMKLAIGILLIATAVWIIVTSIVLLSGGAILATILISLACLISVVLFLYTLIFGIKLISEVVECY